MEEKKGYYKVLALEGYTPDKLEKTLNAFTDEGYFLKEKVYFRRHKEGDRNDEMLECLILVHSEI